ncbi:MAG: hypothetical protein C4295_11130 [Candidatus Fervidibacterota bacterium]
MDGLLRSGGKKLPEIQEPAMFVMFADGAHPEANSSVGRIAFADRCGMECWLWTWSPNPALLQEPNISRATRHMLGSNITWVDGHSKWMSWSGLIGWWQKSGPTFAIRQERTGLWAIRGGPADDGAPDR